jgi:hypothetical protein
VEVVFAAARDTREQRKSSQVGILSFDDPPVSGNVDVAACPENWLELKTTVVCTYSVTNGISSFSSGL